MLTKSLVIAIPLTVVAVWYSALVRDESIVGWTSYKIGAIIAVLVLTNAGQVWILRNLHNRSFWIRFRSNLVIWTTFAVLLTVAGLFVRRGLAVSLWHQGTESVVFVARVVLLVGLTAFVNTVIGYLLLSPMIPRPRV